MYHVSAQGVDEHMINYIIIISLKKGVTPKVHTLCFVLINKVLFNGRLCVWLKSPKVCEKEKQV